MAVLTAQKIIERLYHLGHFHNPSAMTEVTEADLPKLQLSDAAVRSAIRSFQEFNIAELERISANVLGRVSPVLDGEVGPATQALLSVERCGCPDYSVGGLQVEAATGNGSWVHSCDISRPGVHVVTVGVDKSRMPSFLIPIFESRVWPLVLKAYANIGLIFEREDGNPRANIDFKWERLSGSTIGLAILPGAAMRCGDRIWAKFSPTYQPADVVNQWARLVAHELGHNMRLQHTRGGIMNPSITSGPFTQTAWRGDPSFGVLQRYFGGEPVDLDNTPDTPDLPDIPDDDIPDGPLPEEYVRGTIELVRGGKIVSRYSLIPERRV